MKKTLPYRDQVRIKAAMAKKAAAEKAEKEKREKNAEALS